MDAKKREIRNVECELSFREATPEQAAQGELGTIRGRAIVFNSESEIIDEHGERFREVVLPQAVTESFVRSQDIKANLLHKRDLTFARWNKGRAGNMRLFVEPDGLAFEIDVPNCDLGIRARELTRAGVYSGCSFEFLPEVYDVQQRGGNVPVVYHQKFSRIEALTLGMDPAYSQTTLSARELSERGCGGGDDETKRACGGDDETKRACGGDKEPLERTDIDPDEKDTKEPEDMTDEERAAMEAEEKEKEAKEAKAKAELEAREAKTNQMLCRRKVTERMFTKHNY